MTACGYVAFMRGALLAFALAVAAVPAFSQTAGSPQRIISTAPSITEMIYALGLGDRVVGVTEFCHYPPEVREKPKIGSYLRPNIETMLSLRPDLVVLLNEHGLLSDRLRGVGLSVLELQHNNLEGIYSSLRSLGKRTGVREAAERRIAEIQAALEGIRGKAASLPRRTVMFIVGRTPGTIQDVVVVGRGSFLNELIAVAGGQNVFADAGQYYPRIPREEIYARRPDVIVDMGDMSDTDVVTEEHRRSVGKLWEQVPSLPAVEQNRVYPVADDIFVVPGPRVVEAAQSLFEMIHPEANK
ncbi:MAG: cobalamin-binding protein [Acidobacteria bacterium]|nr:cobalamin-binding protein [Acidobacteriota bacterium]